MLEFERPRDPLDARFRLAAATRSVIDELASSTAGDDAFERARDLVEAAAALLLQRGHGRRYTGAEAAVVSSEHLGSFLDDSPFIGELNPLAPPIVMAAQSDTAQADTAQADTAQADTGRVVGEVTYGAAYEGPPSCVHGGFIAAGFDEVLGFAQALTGRPGMTARLEVQYRSPTPLHQPLRYEGRIDRVEGRKIFAVGTLHHGDTLCAEAQALFVSMNPEVFQRLMRAREEPTR